MLFSDHKLPNIRNPIHFKKLYGLEANEGFDISLIPEVENRFKLHIDVIGDHLYTSLSKSTKEYLSVPLVERFT